MLKECADLAHPALSLRPQRTALDDGAEFLNQAAAALRSLGGIAEFEGEAGHGKKIGSGIALVHVIEQGGANIVDGMDIDPGLSIGQTIDASPHRGVLPYRVGRKGITVMWCKRHLLPSHSKVAPGRLHLRFGQHSVPTAGRLASTGALGVGVRFGIGIGAHIGGSQFVLSLPASFQVGGQFISGKDRTFLNADTMVAEDYHVRSDRDLLRQLSVSANVEPIHAGILSLVKAEIPDLHEIPLSRRSRIASIYRR